MFASLGLRSLFTVPLRAATRTVGTLALGRTRSEKWSGEDQSLAVDVGRRAGMLIDNATVLDAEHRALAASDAARARLVLLAELGMGLSSSLDLDPVLDHLASLLVPGLADIYIVDLQDQIIGDRLAAVAAIDPEAKRLFEEAERRLPRRRNPTSSLTRTLESGLPTLIPDCTGSYLSINTPDPEVASIYHHLRLSSTLVVPLVARGGILGAITLLRKETVTASPPTTRWPTSTWPPRSLTGPRWPWTTLGSTPPSGRWPSNSSGGCCPRSPPHHTWPPLPATCRPASGGRRLVQPVRSPQWVDRHRHR